MADQADGLRQLVRERSGAGAAVVADAPHRVAAPPKARSLVLTSGKGGVGTSNLALNLAIALSEQGERVVLVDADLGLANLDLLCGLAPARDLGDVLGGDGSVESAVIDGPAGIKVLPGAHAIRTLPEMLGDAPARLVAGLTALEHSADLILVDAGSGLNPGVVPLAAAADEVVIVTTPEPTSVADAHAAIGRLRRLPGLRLRALVNQVRSAAEARDLLDHLGASSRQFLGAVVTPLGHVRSDPRLPLAVRARRPFVLEAPNAPAARDLRTIARTLTLEPARDPRPDHPRARRPGFFAALAARCALSRVAL